MDILNIVNFKIQQILTFYKSTKHILSIDKSKDEED